ncbi:MAG TPA: hypothetical protein VK581_02910 [Chthoniobacterales bacterium]|nr:hypothetical protein [Chthoniobacterales bacterium]
MIYHLSLQAAGFIAGLFLLLVSVPGLLKPDLSRRFAQALPRSRAAGFGLLTVDFFWSLWLLATMEMGEFSTFRRPLLIFLPFGFFLVLIFVDEFLAVRALGIFFLLAAEPLLDAAFFRSETSRLLVTVFAYLLIVVGLFWVTMPYLLRDQINWSARTTARWRLTHGFALLYGAAILACAVTRY